MNTVFIRNTGQTDLSNSSVYIFINNAPANFTMSPSVIRPTEIGNIKIYNFINENDEIRIATSQGFITTKNAPDPCKEAVLCLKLDEGSGTIVRDSSGNNNHGTLYNGTISCYDGNCPNWVDGKFGKAIKFDGVNDYVETYPNTMNIVGGKMSLAIWIKPLNYPAGPVISEPLRHEYKDASNGGGYLISWRGDVDQRWDLGIVQNDRTPIYPYRPTTSDIPLNQFTYVVLTANGTHVMTYINNQLKGISTYDGTIGNGRNLIIGAYSDSGSPKSRFFNGTIDEVRIYNKAIY